MELKSFGTSDWEVEVWNRVLSKLSIKPILGVEIGCLYGESAEVILESNPNIILTSIDPFIPDSMERSLIGDKEIALLRNKKFIEENRFTLIDGYSWNVAPSFESNSLDFIFIDGNHHYEDVLRDYFDWSPKIKVGGLLFMHDSRMYRPINPSNYHIGPSKVVLERIMNFPKKWEIIDEALSLICAKKLS